jgi:hypothetical protein
MYLTQPVASAINKHSARAYLSEFHMKTGQAGDADTTGTIYFPLIK